MSDRTMGMTVHPPEECARRLGGISVAMLIALLKDGRYGFTMLKAGHKPWGRGRQFWGMTDEQISTVIRGQERFHAAPTQVAMSPDVPSLVITRPRAINSRPTGSDGKTRLKWRKAT
jgi:hypothetical protein